MPRVLLAFVALIAYVACTPAPADEFSWELSGFASESENPALETDRSSLQSTYFFDPVDDANGPYALALFFDPTTRVSVTLSHEKQTASAVFGPPSVAFPELVTKTDDYSIGGRYVLPQSRWYFGGSYTKSDIENPEPFAGRILDASGYGLLIGKYVGSKTSLELTFDSTEHESESPFAVCIGSLGCLNAGTLTSEEQRDHASVNVLHVRRLRSMTSSLSGRIAASSGRVAITTPSFTLPAPIPPPPFGTIVTIPASTLEFSIPRLRSYSVGGELFPTVKLGVRIGYSRWDDDTAADDAYDVATTWFVRRDVGLQFVFSRQTIDDDAAIVITDPDFEHADTATVRVVGRF